MTARWCLARGSHTQRAQPWLMAPRQQSPAEATLCLERCDTGSCWHCSRARAPAVPAKTGTLSALCCVSWDSGELDGLCAGLLPVCLLPSPWPVPRQGGVVGCTAAMCTRGISCACPGRPRAHCRPLAESHGRHLVLVAGPSLMPGHGDGPSAGAALHSQAVVLVSLWPSGLPLSAPPQRTPVPWACREPCSQVGCGEPAGASGALEGLQSVPFSNCRGASKQGEELGLPWSESPAPEGAAA